MKIPATNAALRLSQQVSLDFFMVLRSRRFPAFRFLNEDGGYIYASGRKKDPEPVTCTSWEEAARKAEEIDASFILNCKDGKVLCSEPVAPGKKASWRPVVPIPHPEFLRMCVIYGGEPVVLEEMPA